MAGGEVIAELELDERWSVTSDLEYVYNRNLTDHYPLPFSPPTVVTSGLTYSGAGQNVVSNYAFGLENQWVMEQNRIAKNEERTPGTTLWNLSAQLHWRLGERYVITTFQIDNLLDRAFLNHLSFYRKLNAPEPGRNMQLIVKVPF